MAFLLLALPAALEGQTCYSGSEMDAASKAAIDNAASHFLSLSKNGDVAGLRANSIPALSGDFSSIEQAVVTNKDALGAAPPTLVGSYLLDASDAKAPLSRADFYCGIYNSPDRTAFYIPNLPPGRYALVIQKVNGKNPITLSLVLQNVGGAWKLAGFYPRQDSIAGHNGDWYLNKARQDKAQGKLHDAWFNYLTAWDLTAPVNFMSTPQLDKVASEMQSSRPSDMPSESAPLSLTANGKTFRVTELSAVPVDNKLDLRVRYQNPNAGDSNIAFQDNMAVIRAIVAKYPEVRDTFDAVIARAVNGGQEYGSLLPMKDIK